MNQYTWDNSKTILAGQILCAFTLTEEYSEDRLIILHEYNKYIVLEGGHCSCYDFDEVIWDATEFTGNQCFDNLMDFLKLTDYTGLRLQAYNYLLQS